MIAWRAAAWPLHVLHRRSIRAQLAIVLALVPVVAALHGAWLAPQVVDIAIEGIDGDLRERAILAVRVAVATTVLLVACASASAALLLRGSIRAVVEQLSAATCAIAAGDLAHRVGASRRDELGRLAQSIDAMAERLQRLEHARRRVLACVSHELRTPLTIIQGHAYTLARDESSAIRRDRLELVQCEAVRLARLVDDLVDASGMHAGGLRLQLERCDLAGLVRDRVERHRELAAQQGISLELRGAGGGVPVDLDPGRIEQVLDNLLANAVRHAAPGSTVRLRIDAARGGARIVEVENRCEPIAAAVVERMFEPFVQGGDGRGGSLGLGLAIASAIVEAHGGSIDIDAAAAMRGCARLRVELAAPIEHAPDAERVRGRGWRASSARLAQVRP